MRLHVHPTPEAAATEAANLIAAQVTDKPSSVLGLATGGTMEPVYANLREKHESGLSFADAITFNLDEYVGLSGDHPQSYRRYMQHHFFDHVDICQSSAYLPRGDISPEEASEEYEALLQKFGPIDLQLLGLGRNGHIGFNEPLSSLASRTREKSLTKSTLEANSRFFNEGERQPTTAITMGIASIMDAKRIIVLAVGDGKADAVAAMIEGPVTSMCPGSILQMHAQVTVIVDEAAAAKLTMREYA